MKVIIGLGNPGPLYAQSRHNAGALFIQWLCKEKLKPKATAQPSRYCLYTINETLHLCIPTTFMNESGKAVHALLRKYPTLTPNDFLIVHDDLEHKIGNVRVKEGGSAQGHNGVDSVAKFLGTNSFKRLQLGISRPESRDPQVVAKYVLSKFSKDELSKLKQSFNKALEVSKQHNFL